MPSFLSVVKLTLFGLIFSLLTKFKLGIQALLKVERQMALLGIAETLSFSFRVCSPLA